MIRSQISLTDLIIQSQLQLTGGRGYYQW